MNAPFFNELKTFAAFLAVVILLLQGPETAAFSSSRSPTGSPRRAAFTARRREYAASTVEAPTREDVETERRTRRGGGNDDTDLGDFGENFDDAVRSQGPLEYLEDMNESREMDDPFHILLLSSTFEKPKITVPYVAGSLQYVLDMPSDEATELSKFSYEHGMSCLGTWSREECLSLGRQLQVRDIVCRVVPFCEGGQRGWQARDANNQFSNTSS